MPHIDGLNGRLACRCCGEETNIEAFCWTCRHQYDDWCAKGDGKCKNCGGLLDDEGKCGTKLLSGEKCEWQRTRENSDPANKLCISCGNPAYGEACTVSHGIG